MQLNRFKLTNFDYHLYVIWGIKKVEITTFRWIIFEILLTYGKIDHNFAYNPYAER